MKSHVLQALNRNSRSTGEMLAIRLVLLGLSIVPVISCEAQDRILIQQSAGSRFPMSGYVEDYTGRELVVRIRPKEPVRTYPRSEVIEVTTEYTPHHDRGRKLFASGKIVDARREFTTSLEEEDRPWVRREILASLVKCALWKGDYREAAITFQAIVHTDAETFHYGLIPLNWTNDLPPANLQFEARDWISPESSSLRKLIAASWLFHVADNNNEATQVLKRLTRDADLRIQRLAQMQTWRLKLQSTEPIEAVEIRRWEKFVEELPVELRGGSYYLIGQAWKQRKEFERAARAYLWLPLVYDSDRWLSGRACFEAGLVLTEIGDRTQSSQLFSEVVFRYSDTLWGKKAEDAWNAVRPPTSN